MHDQINEAMFELAMTVSKLVAFGYSFETIESGDRRFGIGPKLNLMKDGKAFSCYSVEDLDRFLYDEYERRNEEARQVPKTPD